MTRINLVEPKQLLSKHLMAEYRELPRVFTALKKSHAKSMFSYDHGLPASYVLGRGHVKFFYNKLNFLSNRYEHLHEELLSRGYNLDKSIYYSNLELANRLYFSEMNSKGARIFDDCQIDNWRPSPEEVYLNMARITNRAGYNGD